MNPTDKLAQSRKARLDALLAVANHPRTDPEEARTALAGARKVAERAGLTDEYGVAFSFISMGIELGAVRNIWAKFSKAVADSMKATQ